MGADGLVIATIFARNRASDTFLQGRSLVHISGKTVLDHIVSRLTGSGRISRILVACTKDESDETIALECSRLGIECFRGDQAILHRILEIVGLTGCSWVVGVNGNYPLVDVAALDMLVDECAASGADFGYNGHLSGIPYGMDVEIIGRSLFEKLDINSLDVDKLASGTCFLRVCERISVVRQNYANPRPEMRLCLETRKDLVLLSEILDRCSAPEIEDVISLFDRNPALFEINRDAGDIQEIGANKLCAFPEKLPGLLHSGTPDFSYPVSIELSLTDRCNQKCIWCSDAALRERSNSELSFDLLERLFDDLMVGGVRGVVVEGGGEPTLHPEFARIVHAIRNRKLDAGLITNGLLPLAPELLQQFSWIRISLDASTPEEYRQLKGVDGFDQVLSNIASIACQARVCGVGYVVTSANVGDIESLVLRLKSMGASYIHLRPVIDHEEMICVKELSFLKKYASTEFSVMLDAMTENRIRGNNSLPCVSHSLSTVIAANGDVFLCGRLNKYDWWPAMGNIGRQSFKEIWSGESRRQQAFQVASAEFCEQNCPECRMTKYNVLIANISKIKTRSFI